MDINLFAGAGGLGLGLRQAGFAPSHYFEIDRPACQTLLHNITSTTPTLEGVVSEGDLSLMEWLDTGPPIRLLAAGTPCQPFSLGGSHLGQEDSRNLFPHVLKAVRALSPKCVLIENVRGLHRPSMGAYFQYIIDQLTHPWIEPVTDENWLDHHTRLAQDLQVMQGEAPYKVQWALLNAADYGAPQVRYRLFIIATRSDVDRYEFPAKTHSKNALINDQRTGKYWARHGRLNSDKKPRNDILETPALMPWTTVRDVLAGLPDASPNEDMDANNHWVIPGARSYPGHTGSSLDWAAKTMKAGVHGVPGGENTIVCDDGRVRYFTLREMARIQTFPDEHFFCGARSSVVKQIGNAVPCILAAAVARPLLRLLEPS